MSRYMVNILVCVLLYLVAAVIMNMPVSTHLCTQLPYPDDPLLNTWIMAWVARALVSDPINLFQANIFYPHAHTLCYSEHIIGNQPVFMPVYFLTDNPVCAYNTVYLTTFVVSGLGMCMLVVYLGYGWFPAFAGGLIYAFCPFRMSQIMHIQIISAHWMPFLFLFMHRFLREPGFGNASGILVFFNLQLLCSYYLGIFASLAILFYFVFSVRTLIVTGLRQLAKYFLPGLCLTVVLQVPLMIPYYNVKQEQGLYRDVAASEIYSASWKQYLSTPSHNRVYGSITAPFRKWEGALFPGLAAIILALTGLLTIRTSDGSNLKAYIVFTIFCLIMSFGPYYKLGDRNIPLPYLLFYHVYPGFKALRVPTRFATMIMLGISVCAGAGTHYLLRMTMLRKRFVKQGAMVVITAIILLEYFSVPLPSHTFKVNGDIPEVYQWLAGQPDDSAVLELPFQGKQTRGAPLSVYYSTYHWKKIVNGYSGFFPGDYRVYAQQASRIPEKSAMEFFREKNVRLVIDHEPYQVKEDKLPDIMKLIRTFPACKVYKID